VLAGAPVTYTATVTPSPDGGTVAFSDGAGNPATVNCAARPLTGNQATCTVSYLAAGVFSVTATYSGDGTSNNDAASTSSPLLETVRTVPGAPTGISATAADEQATVSFAAPASNGGDAITGYTVTASPGGQTSSGGSSPITVTGLTDGTTYTFTVTATNSVGTGLQSAASNAVTPRDTHAPTAPAALTGRIAHNSLLLSWRASLDNLGVDHYEIYRNSSPILRVPGTAIVASLRSFQPRVASVFDVRAFDAAGNQSERSGSVTVTRVPRPKSAPKRIPRWAWQLLAWQKHHTGPKPATPKPLPHWYGAWKTWRNGLFRLLG
jgi:hypothetical protein